MDCDDDWDMLGEDANLGGAAEDDGWGVNSEMFTTKLTGVSESLRQKAADMARQIRSGKTNYAAKGSTNEDVFVPDIVGESETNISSAEDALKLLAMKQKEAAAAPPAPPANKVSKKPQMSTKEDERAALKGLRKQLSIVREKLRKFGNPSPVQCGKFLKMLTAGLIKTLRYPRPDVRGPVTKYFRDCSWEIRQNRSVRGSRPPTGAKLENLLVQLVSFFAKRFGEPVPAPKGPKKAFVRGGSRRNNPSRRKHTAQSEKASSQDNRRGGRRQQRRRAPRDTKGEEDATNVGGSDSRKEANQGTWKRASNRNHRKVSTRTSAASQKSGGGKHSGQGRNRRRGGVAGSGGRDSGSRPHGGRN